MSHPTTTFSSFLLLLLKMQRFLVDPGKQHSSGQRFKQSHKQVRTAICPSVVGVLGVLQPLKSTKAEFCVPWLTSGLVSAEEQSGLTVHALRDGVYSLKHCSDSSRTQSREALNYCWEYPWELCLH